MCLSCTLSEIPAPPQKVTAVNTGRAQTSLLSWKIPWPHTFLCKKVTKIVCCCHMCTFSIPWGRSCQFWNSWGWRAQLWKGVLQSQSQKMAVTLKIIWFQAPIICSAFFPSFSESQNERIWDVSDDWEPNSLSSCQINTAFLGLAMQMRLASCQQGASGRSAQGGTSLCLQFSKPRCQ